MLSIPYGVHYFGFSLLTLWPTGSIWPTGLAAEEPGRRLSLTATANNLDKHVIIPDSDIEGISPNLFRSSGGHHAFLLIYYIIFIITCFNVGRDGEPQTRMSERS